MIIKAATGSGSVGIRVCRTYEEAEAFLLSGAFDKNAIVERLLEGEEYGVEIHGCGGKYIVSPPYRKLSYEEDVVNDPLGATTLKYGRFSAKASGRKPCGRKCSGWRTCWVSPGS